MSDGSAPRRGETERVFKTQVELDGTNHNAFIQEIKETGSKAVSLGDGKVTVFHYESEDLAEIFEDNNVSVIAVSPRGKFDTCTLGG